MEEKKKRWRPSLGAYRALEREVSMLREELRIVSEYDENDVIGLVRAYEEQMEGKSRLVADCDSWRDKYRRLAVKNELVEKSHDFLEREIERLRAKTDEDMILIKDLNREVTYLRNRGFWDRLFNR